MVPFDKSKIPDKSFAFKSCSSIKALSNSIGSKSSNELYSLSHFQSKGSVTQSHPEFLSYPEKSILPGCRNTYDQPYYLILLWFPVAFAKVGCKRVKQLDRLKKHQTLIRISKGRLMSKASLCTILLFVSNNLIITKFNYIMLFEQLDYHLKNCSFSESKRQVRIHQKPHATTF